VNQPHKETSEFYLHCSPTCPALCVLTHVDYQWWRSKRANWPKVARDPLLQRNDFVIVRSERTRGLYAERFMVNSRIALEKFGLKASMTRRRRLIEVLGPPARRHRPARNVDRDRSSIDFLVSHNRCDVTRQAGFGTSQRERSRNECGPNWRKLRLSFESVATIRLVKWERWLRGSSGPQGPGL